MADAATQAQVEPQKKKGFKFPSAFTVLFFVLLIVWGLTFVIKPGSYTYVSCDGDDAKPIPGSYQSIEVDLTFKDRLYDLCLSPVNGLYGIREVPTAVEEAPSAETEQAAQEACGEGVEARDRHAARQHRPVQRGRAGRRRPGVLLRARHRCLHHGDHAHRRARRRHRPGHPPLPHARVAADHHPDGDLLDRRYHVRHGRGDPGLLRPARARSWSGSASTGWSAPSPS